LDGSSGDFFGSSVSVDGNVAVAGAPYNAGAGYRFGAVYVFERNAGGTNGWGQVAKLTASDGAESDSFGISAAVVGDAVVVGAFQDDDAGSWSGSAYVFERNAGGINTWGQVAKLTASDGTTNDLFGVSVSADGDVAVVGAAVEGAAGYGADSAYILPISTETKVFLETAKPTASDGADGDAFGFSAAVAGDVAVVGARYDDVIGANFGSAYVFERNAGGTAVWSRVCKLTALDATKADEFGVSVSVDGDVTVVGASGDDDAGSDSGSAYVFERNAGGINAWSQVAKLTASDGAAGDGFGFAAAVAGDVAVVGAAWAQVGAGTWSGSAYVFERNAGGTNAWGQVAKLTASDANASDQFGYSVSVAGDVVVVGANVPTDEGAAYVFERNAGGINGWGQVAKLTASDGEAEEEFGFSVAVAGDVALIGACKDDDAGTRSGSAYIFERNAGGDNAWGQVAELMASDGEIEAQFGVSVSVAGDVALVGAFSQDDVGVDSGAAYVFERNAGGTNAWGQVAKLTASDAAASDYFGISVSVGGDVMLVGARGDDDAGDAAGSAYIFEEFFPVSQPVIVDMSVQGSDAVCEWTSTNPVDYTVQVKDALDDDVAWSNLTGCIDMPGQDGTMSATNAVNGKGFVRIKAVNSPIR
ncbi:MAG: hypothetical protein HQ559_13945, partial [Lentisphaerae bacterium]|nr:hypothetical protein [Lentisphaerota bacterium]